jgi:hypothetical protein
LSVLLTFAGGLLVCLPAGVAAGTVGGVAGVVCGSKMAFDWFVKFLSFF